jgi:sterol desaturase/sphingolipid hydroxylase (fatty acid hydroxylase superfamily)
LSLWDWIFGTAYWPKDKEQPEKYGFYGMKRFPKGVIGRLFHPFIKFKK